MDFYYPRRMCRLLDAPRYLVDWGGLKNFSTPHDDGILRTAVRNARLLFLLIKIPNRALLFALINYRLGARKSIADCI